MSKCTNTTNRWNVRHQKQEQVEKEEGNRYSNVHQWQKSDLIPAVVPMSNYEVAELTWENGQLSMHGLGGILPTASTKQRYCSRVGDTLESIVHQATTSHKNKEQHDRVPDAIFAAPSEGKWSNDSEQEQARGTVTKKRMRLEFEQQQKQGRNSNSSSPEEYAERRGTASAGPAFCRDDDTTMMTLGSLESKRSLRTKTMDEDSVSHGGLGSEEKEDRIRGETDRSHTSRRHHAAAVHNQSERRRRERINEKMKTLQKMVPNASKTDKASMLDEVIAYLKQLQTQVQIMSLGMGNMQQVMMPVGMQQQQQQQQQQLQMSLMARMGIGMGMGLGVGNGTGMLDLYSMARAAAPQSLPAMIPPSAAVPTFVPPPFLVPHSTLHHNPSQPNPDASITTTTTASSIPFSDPYSAFLAQATNAELYKMAALYQQQANQATQATNPPPQASHVRVEK